MSFKRTNRLDVRVAAKRCLNRRSEVNTFRKEVHEKTIPKDGYQLSQ